MTTLTTPTRLLLLATTLALAACGSKEGRIESGLKKGAEFARQADWDKANVEVRNVLQIDPKNGPAYLIAAQATEAQGDPRKAFNQYAKALELAPTLIDAKVGMARLLVLNNELALAEERIKEILLAQPQHPIGRTLQGALLVRQGKADEALALVLQVAKDTNPVPVDARLLLAGVYANKAQWQEALAVLEAGLKADPKNMALIQAAVSLVASNPQDKTLAAKAADFYKGAVEASPKNRDLWLGWASYHLARKELDPAEAVLRAAIKAQPDDGKRPLALVEFLATSRGAEVAEKQYLDFIKDKPRDMALRFGLAKLYRDTNRLALSQQELQKIADQKEDAPSALSARTQLAAFRVAEGKLDDAQALLAEVLKANPRDNAALVLRGRLALMAGNGKDAVVDLRAALRDQAGSTEIVQLLAQAHRAANEPQLAREVLADATKLKPQDLVLRGMLVADMADSKDFKSAYAELDNAIKLQPAATPLYEMKAQLALRQKDLPLAQKTLEQLKSQNPKLALPYVRLGQFYTQQKKYDAALKEYDAGAAAVPADPTFYIASVTLLTSLKRHGEAAARIEAARKESPQNVLHLQLAGEMALNRRDWPAAEKSFTELVAAMPTQGTGYLSLAKVQGAKGDSAAALATLAQGEKAAPTDRSLVMARAEWFSRLKRYDEAIALYEALHKQYPEDDLVVNNLAYLLAEIKGDKPSVARALALAGRFAQSPNPGYLDSLGWIHYQSGQYDKAVTYLERAVALAQPSPLLQLHLGKALVKNGDANRGRALIQKAIDSKVDLPRLDEARALLAQG
jgi:predicted Zn-dependent protease